MASRSNILSILLQFSGSQALEEQNERFSGIFFVDSNRASTSAKISWTGLSFSEIVDLIVISATSQNSLLCVASLRNHLTWHDTPEGDQVLNLETELSVSLEVWYSSALPCYIEKPCAADAADH